MLQLRNVTVSCSKKEILHEIGFDANRAEISVILGKNGSGKTTLLRAVSGALAYRGSITVAGREIRTMKSRERARTLALMPQMFRAPDISVRDLVSFGRQPYAGLSGILSAADKAAVEGALERTGLLPLADLRMTAISGGERQKAYFAMLLAQDTPVLLLDEPGAHLDMAYRRQLADMLRAERDAGKTVVAVFHDLNRAAELADRLLVINGGTLLFDGAAQELFDSDIPREIFGLERCRCLDKDGRETRPVFR